MALRDHFSNELGGVMRGLVWGIRCELCWRKVSPGAIRCQECERTIAETYAYEGSGAQVISAHGSSRSADGNRDCLRGRGPQPGRRRNNEPRQISCGRCGCAFESRSNNPARHCPECRPVIHLEQMNAYYAKTHGPRQCLVCGGPVAKRLRICSAACRESHRVFSLWAKAVEATP